MIGRAIFRYARRSVLLERSFGAREDIETLEGAHVMKRRSGDMSLWRSCTRSMNLQLTGRVATPDQVEPRCALALQASNTRRAQIVTSKTSAFGC